MSNLKELQAKIGGKINIQQLMDANVKTIKSTQYLTNLKVNGLKTRIDDFGAFFKIEIDIITDLLFSINIPNNLHLLVKPTSNSELVYPVFLPKAQVNNDEKLRLFITTIANFVNHLKLQEDEGVLIFSDAMSLVLASGRDILGLLEKVGNMLVTNPNVFKIPKKKTRISSKGLPISLQPLVPYITDWAISDDLERSEAIEKMTPEQRKDLINVVWPLMKDINAYLDSFKDKTMPEVAMYIGNLAELVSELSINNN